MDKREPTLQEFMSAARTAQAKTSPRPASSHDTTPEPAAPRRSQATPQATPQALLQNPPQESAHAPSAKAMAAAPAAAPKPNGAAPARAKAPPEDPEAFRRWAELERLKVDMRRLEIENRRLANETRRAEASAPRRRDPSYGQTLLTAGVAATVLLLVALLALGLFQTVTLHNQLTALQSEVGGLRMAFADLEDKVAEIASAPPATTAEASPPAAPAPAPAPAAEPAPAVAPPPPKPSGPGAGYIVRVFAPTGSVPPAKVEQFTNSLKAAGFEVLISDAGVVNPASNTLSYHASAEAMAKKLAALVQAKRPALNIEVRPSPSIPDSARNILILNVTEDALK